MRKNNKGFTLVELLGVMIILISISMVVVIGITASLEKRDIKDCKEQQELAVSAAKIYFSLTNNTSVTVYTLNYGVTPDYLDFFKDNKKIDKLSPSDVITISGNTYLYNGKLVGESCE